MKVLLTKEPKQVESMDGQQVLGRVELAPSAASQQPDAIEEVETGADEQNDHRGRITGSPDYLVIGVEDGEDEERERDCGDDTEREILEGGEATKGNADELWARTIGFSYLQTHG